MLSGYADRFKSTRRRDAWTVSHLLVAAGCDPEKVSPAKLLGEKERTKKKPQAAQQKPIDEIWRAMRGEADGN